MNVWQALKQIFGQSTVYKKQLILFLAAFIIGGGVLYYVKNQNYHADVEDFTYQPEETGVTFNATVSKSGKISINGQTAKKLLTAKTDSDEIRWIIYDQPKDYVGDTYAYITLPEGVNLSKVKTDIIAMGIQTYDVQKIDKRTLLFSAQGIMKGATFTIVVDIPKGVIDYPIWMNAVNYLLIQSIDWWLYSSVVLAFITLILLYLLLKRRLSINSLPKPKYFLDHPPSTLPPAIVSVLKTGKVGSKEIASTLIDLSQRGYINIFSKGPTFTFGKTKKLEAINVMGLERFEQILLDKIFTETYRSTKEDIEVRVGRHIFSRKIAEVYFLIYDMVTAYGFFEENPYKTHRKYKLMGIILFFISAICFIAGAFINKASFSLFMWFALMISAAVIIQLSSKIMPIRTAKGNEVLKEWLAYENFLGDNAPVAFRQDLSSYFAQNLSYAIALGKEVEWTERFLQYPFYLPNWFDAAADIRTLDEFANELFPLVGFIGGAFAQVHEPTID